MVLSSLFFKEIWKNGTRGHRRMLMLKEGNNRRFDSYRVRNSVLIISHITFNFGIVASTFFLLTFLEIAVLTRWLAQLGRLSQGEKIRACVNTAGSGKGVNFILI